jgi:tRNA A-37 threonylcarbamoyl transferase component Bud32
VTTQPGISTLVWPAGLADFATRSLGPCSLVADLSWPYEGSEVYRIRDAGGADHVLKRVINDRFYGMEVAGYRWAPALGAGRAPRLEAADPALRAVIVSFLPGAPMLGAIDPDTELHAYRQVGRLLALLHGAAPPSRDTAVLERLLERSEQQLSKAAAELSPAQQKLARRAASLLTEIGPQLRAVPTHGDLQPRNQLLDNVTRTVALIDFEKAALAPPVRDLVRLEPGIFTGRPLLREAFYEGYGRDLEPFEVRALHAWVVLDSVSALAWGIPNHDEEIVLRARTALNDPRFTDLDLERPW